VEALAPARKRDWRFVGGGEMVAKVFSVGDDLFEESGDV
jgi:hypothetical protein